MKFRTSTIVLLCMCLFALTMPVSQAAAQIERLTCQPGDIVEVEFQREWYTAEVIEIFPGEIAMRARFTDSRGREREFMFPSMKVRAAKVAQPKPAVNAPRTWTSSDGKFRVEAEFVRRDGDKAVLRKTDGKSISVPLESLSKKDIAFIENLPPVTTNPDMASFGTADSQAEGTEVESPFIEIDDPAEMAGTRIPPADTNRRVPDHAPANSSPARRIPSSDQDRRPIIPVEKSADDLRPDNGTVPVPSNSTGPSSIIRDIASRQEIPGNRLPATSNIQQQGKGLSLTRWGIFLASLLVGGSALIWGMANRNRYI